MRAEAAATSAPTFFQFDREAYRLGAKGGQLANAVRGTLGIESIAGDACDT